MNSSPPERCGAPARHNEVSAPELDGPHTPGSALPLDALTRAAAAMDSLSGELEELFAQDLLRLVEARDAWRRAPGPASAMQLKGCAHELKGLGATCGHPLAGRIGASLERLLETPAPPPALVDAHVDSVGAIVQRAELATDPSLALELVCALEAVAAAHG